MKTVLVPLLAAACLALVGLGAAQAPSPSPVASVSIVEAPTEAGQLQANGTISVPLKVQLTASGFGCTQSATLPVTLAATVEGAPAGVGVEPASQTLNFTVAQGLYAGAPPAAAEYTGLADATLSLLGGDIQQNGTFVLKVVATFAGSLPTGCQAPGALPASEDTRLVNASALAAPPPILPPPPPEEKGFLPATQVVGLLAALAVASGLRRRRRA